MISPTSDPARFAGSPSLPIAPWTPHPPEAAHSPALTSQTKRREFGNDVLRRRPVLEAERASDEFGTHLVAFTDVPLVKERAFANPSATRRVANLAPPSHLQEEFFASLGSDQPLRRLFEHIPGVLFFAKDAQSRLMCGSPALLERLGVGSERDLIGRSDYDFFPAHVAERFIADDQAVQRTGKPLVDRVELWYSEQHILDWFVTTKLPLLDGQSRPIGVMGIMRSYEGKRKALALCSNLLRVIDHLSAHLDGNLALADLAKAGGLSERQLQRKFRAVFRMSVQQFVIKTRIQHAAKAVLNSDRCLSDIAAEFGFCDQSAFTRQFRLHTGLSPLKFRRQFWK